VTELPVFLIVFLALIGLMLWFAFRHLAPRRVAEKDASVRLPAKTGHLI
jgi:hypothetical protein